MTTQLDTALGNIRSCVCPFDYPVVFIKSRVSKRWQVIVNVHILDTCVRWNTLKIRRECLSVSEWGKNFHIWYCSLCFLFLRWLSILCIYFCTLHLHCPSTLVALVAKVHLSGVFTADYISKTSQSTASIWNPSFLLGTMLIGLGKHLLSLLRNICEWPRRHCWWSNISSLDGGLVQCRTWFIWSTHLLNVALLGETGITSLPRFTLKLQTQVTFCSECCLWHIQLVVLECSGSAGKVVQGHFKAVLLECAGVVVVSWLHYPFNWQGKKDLT